MEFINLSLEQYNTQRDNVNQPFSACMPTSYQMFLIGNRIPYQNRSVELFGEQLKDDDYFMALLNTKEAREYAYKKYSWAYNSVNPSLSIPPNQLHGMYGTYLSSFICNSKASDFLTSFTFEDYVSYIKNGKVLMTSGSFPKAKIIGHAFCIIGYNEEKNCLYLSDPFGNFLTNYKDTNGYKIEMTKEDFIKHIKPCNEEKKWAHIPLI